MAHEPKLEVYKIYLSPSSGNTKNTFKDFLEAKYDDPDLTITQKYTAFFRDIVNSINNSYYKSKRRKKAISLKEKEEANENDQLLTIRSQKKIIEGMVKGGRYGQRRFVGDMTHPESDHEELDDAKIVLDNFYFLLYSPLGSDKAILMLQSYTDDNVNDIFISFIRAMMKTAGFNKPLISPYCPEVIQEQFRQSSHVKEIVFKQDITLPDIDEVETITSKDLIVEIKITAKDEGENLTQLGKLVKHLERYQFKQTRKKDIPLEEFNKKTGKLVSGGHQSSFELDGTSIDIKPTIYLKSRISLQADETPNWNSLKKFCDELLDDIKKEVYPEHEIS